MLSSIRQASVLVSLLFVGTSVGETFTASIAADRTLAGEVELVQHSVHVQKPNHASAMKLSKPAPGDFLSVEANTANDLNVSASVVRDAVDHCLVKRGLSVLTTKPNTKVYMHSGTAAHFLKCREGLNEVDIWIPQLAFTVAAKNPLAEAYPGPNVTWLNGSGLTSKGREEQPEQLYCPKEYVPSENKWYLEINAYIGEEGVFDKPPFDKIASDAMWAAVQLDTNSTQYSWGLYVVGSCELIKFKSALAHGGQTVVQEADVEDYECLFNMYPKCALWGVP